MPTTWNTRTPPETSWWERLRPITFETPLQDAYTEVADEDNEVIYDILYLLLFGKRENLFNFF